MTDNHFMPEKRFEVIYKSAVFANKQLEKKIQELSIVSRINDALRFLPDLKKVCCEIITVIKQEMNVRTCSLMILDPEKSELTIKALWSLTQKSAVYISDDSSFYRFKLDEGVSGTVARQGKPILIRDVTEDDRFISIHSSSQKIKSLLCMPLKVGKEVVGVLNLSHHNADMFGKAEKHLLKLISNQIAVAIKNVRLFEDITRLNHSLEKRVKERTRELEQSNARLVETRDQLIHSEKMAAVGTLAGGVAHEFNNLLCMMQGYSELALQKGDIASYEKALNVVLSSSGRAKEIAQNLLSFSRRKESKLQNIDIRVAMDETLSLIQHDIEKDNITIERHYSKVPEIVCDVALMQQVFLNLIINARHAMHSMGGKLTIHIAKIKQCIVIKISDTGCGIPKELQKKVFEPFFTTKGVWGDEQVPGTGLGLSVSLGVVESHGGTMELQSEQGKGTTFIISLPIRILQDVNNSLDTSSHRQCNVRNARILVADDEEAIRELLYEMLTLQGHQVTVVRNVYEAAKCCSKDFFDIVFLDVMMPEINGLETARMIQDVSRTTKIVFITGMSMVETGNNRYDLTQFQNVPFIKKPFKFSDLNEVLTKVLEGKPLESSLFYKR
ncbi:response regulator [bacterium]|nr:response regulator [bacterium]